MPEFEKHTVETEAPEKDWLRPARVPGSPQRLLKWERVCVLGRVQSGRCWWA